MIIGTVLKRRTTTTDRGRLSACAARVALLLGLMWSTLLQAQGIDLRERRVSGVEDYDFEWVSWFEMQGRGYLHEALSERLLPWDTPASRRWRGDAVEALTSALEDADDGVRASAVLALGRMREKELAGRILPSEQGPGLLLDESEDVRVSAWASLGLLDTEETRAALAAAPVESSDELDRATQAMAIGLLGKPDRVHRNWLIARLDDPGESLEVKRWCVWAVRHHDDASHDAVFDAALGGLASTFVMDEVLLSRGYVERSGGVQRMIDVMRYHPDVRGWAGYRSLALMPAEGAFGSTPRRLAMETRIAASLTLAQLPRPEREEDRRELLSHLRRRMLPGNSEQAMDFNRGFDTISYFMHCDASNEELDLLYDLMRGFTLLLPDDPAVSAGLKEGEEPRPEDLRVRQSDNAVRGYAALSAGLIIRRATEGNGLYRSRPIVGREAIEIERLKRRFGQRLMRAVADRGEPMSYRAACALALGLSGEGRYRAELIEELSKLQAGDEAVLGYGLLSLAMLGEDRAADPARRYVTRPGAVAGMDDQLGRRAAMRALALIGARGGEDVKLGLAEAWGRDPWVSLSAAEATAQAGSYEAMPTILKAMKSESPTWRRAGAVSLGVVFDSAYPSRLSMLVEGANPTVSMRGDLQKDGFTAPLGLTDLAADDRQGVTASERAGSDWPMSRLYALGDPFVFEAMRAAAQAPSDEKPVPEEDEEPTQPAR